jgi:Tfp pilus assembly protein PilW
MRTRSSRSGFTLIETTIAAGLSLLIALGLGTVVTVANRLAERSRANTQASQEHRRGLEHIANALRSASWDTLTGFDGAGVATAPAFQTVTGSSGGNPTLSSTAQIQWQATPPVRGVTSPGEVVLTQDGVSIRLAERVPSGGFSVTELGAALQIHLETFAPLPNGEIARATGDTLVLIRN